MNNAVRVAPLALVLLPLLSWAQAGATGAVGLEIPAPAPPGRGHFLTGAYVSGGYAPLLTTAGFGYAVQPYLRYVPGATGRARPFVQYNFAPFWVQQAYGSAALFGPGGVELPPNPGFAPLAARNPAYSGHGSLGAFSVGVPLRVAKAPLLLNVGGSVLEGVVGGFLR